MSATDEGDAGGFESKEKIFAFGVALFIALCLWFIVNLSRDFNVSIEVPIMLTNLPDDVTISSDVPESALVTVTGEGWNLISVYTNPPRIFVSIESSEVNLSEQIRNQVSAFSNLNIVQVRPSQFTIQTERSISKKVPVINRVELNLSNQYGLLREPTISPDSVTVTGAESMLEEIDSWDTANLELTNINGSMMREIRLNPGGSGISVSPSVVTLNVEAAEFTEAELRVPIRTRNLPSGRAVSYNPSAITVRFDVPINQFSDIQGIRLFNAFVDYTLIADDDSGRVTPELEVVDNEYHVRIRSFQPPRVSYFRIIPD
ncbi:MAG: CdaR family protein [Balneolaceae bacterium]